MSERSIDNWNEHAMQDLFCMEAEAQCAVLLQGLQKLALAAETDMAPLLKAAQAIDSAAWMAEREREGALAKAIGKRLQAIEQGEWQVDAACLEDLSGAVSRLQALAAERMPAGGMGEEDEALLARLTQAPGGNDTAPETESAGEEETPAPGATEDSPAGAPAAEAPATEPASSAQEDRSMLELFAVEVEVQSAILTGGLLELEQDPGQTGRLEELMRAAHSIKGAARMVDVSPAVRIAHVMEDCFVAAQKGELAFTGEHIDVLLAGVDMLALIAREGSAAVTEEEVTALAGALEAVLAGGPAAAPPAEKLAAPAKKAAPPVKKPVQENTASAPPADPQAGAAEEKPAAPAPKPAAGDAAIRVSAENLNRLMGLAGEVQVVSQGLQPFNDALLHLKQRQAEVISVLDRLGNVIEGDEYVCNLLTDAQQRMANCREMLTGQISELDDYACRSQGLAARLNREVVSSRMRPFMDGARGFQRMVRDVARSLGKQVDFVIRGQNTPVDRDILEKIEAPLNHLLRNAIDHGIEDPAEREQAGKPARASLVLEAQHSAGMLSIRVEDDGRGIDLEHLRRKIVSKKMVSEKMAAQMMESELMEFLFLPGFSTRDDVTEISGRGVGLDVVHSVVQEMRGVVRATSTPGKGMCFHMQLPLTLSVIRALLVEVAGEPWAFPLARIEHTLKLSRERIEQNEGRQFFTHGHQHVGLVSAHQILEMPAPENEAEELPVVILGERMSGYGVVVDRFLGERNLVVQPLDPRLGKIRDISSGAILDDGTLCLILDVDDMLRSIDIIVSGGRLDRISRAAEASEQKEGKRILVVDDSITVREVERGMLEAKGYVVEVAVDGMDGWNAVRTGQYDLVISDIDMPRMNGFELVGKLKQDPVLKSMPVMIVSYKDREEDRLRGLEAGADYYLTKGSFHDETLLDAVRDLIGEA